MKKSLWTPAAAVIAFGLGAALATAAGPGGAARSGVIAGLSAAAAFFFFRLLASGGKAAAPDPRSELLPVLDTISDLVALIDINGKRIYNSPSYKKSLADPEKLRGTDSFHDIHPEDRDRVMEIFRRTVRTGVGERAEYRFLLPDGSVRYIESQGNVVKNADGSTRHIVMVSRDISHRKKLEEQLRQAQKMEALGQLAGGVAHDFNNIITSLIGYAGFIAAACPPGSQMAEDAGEIRKVAERATALSRQLLAFSRRQILSPKITDLNVIVSGIQKMLGRLIGANIEIVAAPHKSPVLARVDPGQMEQVILNLAVNARDAMPSGGRLTVSVFPCAYEDYLLGSDLVPGNYAVLSVADTGTGIDAGIHSKIFEPFFTTKRPGEGTGLGLSTVYGIVKQSGGHIVFNTTPGKGTVFTVYLPLAEGEVERSPGGTAATAPKRGTETVLLVEDDHIVRAMTRRILQENGYTALEASSDSEAMLLASGRHKRKIDVILTDIVLPGMNGFELAAKVSAENPGIARVYMSGYTDPAIIKAEFIKPESPLIQKPFDPDALLAGLRAALDSRRSAI